MGHGILASSVLPRGRAKRSTYPLCCKGSWGVLCSLCEEGYYLTDATEDDSDGDDDNGIALNSSVAVGSESGKLTCETCDFRVLGGKGVGRECDGRRART